MRKTTATAFLLRAALFVPVVFGAPALEWSLQFFPTTSQWDWLARDVLSGNPVWIPDEDRTLKAACLRQLPPEKTWLVLGSSRAMAIDPEWFPAKNVWNAAVRLGGIDDSAALLEVYRDAGRMPKGVILEFSPALVRTLSMNEALSLLQYRHRAAERYGIDPGAFRLKPRDFYWDNTMVDARLHFELLRRAHSPALDIEMLPDGMMRPPFPETPLSQAAVLDYVKTQDPRVIADRLRSRPEPNALLFFRRFLDDLQAHGVRVIAFLPPVNPYAWDYYRTRGGYDESIVRKELNARNILIVGSYSPLATGATPDEFYDDVHPRPALVHRLLAESGVLSQTGEAISAFFTQTNNSH